MNQSNKQKIEFELFHIMIFHIEKYQLLLTIFIIRIYLCLYYVVT